MPDSLKFRPSALRLPGGVRLTEWRARRVPDPVARLQFLQRQAVPARLSPSSSKSPLLLARTLAITLALVLTGAALLRPWASAPTTQKSNPPHAIVRQVSDPAASVSAVWLVEGSEHFDLYSNGLRVENQFLTGTASRRYLAFARSRPRGLGAEWQTRPAGIVFHTTESHIVPFSEDQNRELRRDGEGLLEYVRRRRSYHFVIDRFGRVFRIVKETDYANHAGNSVWADDERVFVNLNQSFFGVAFEAKNTAQGEDVPVTPAQIRAGRILVEMLRSRYAIPAENCIGHGQVSVNPDNGRAGYHIDWAANLPFGELGLNNNYKRPLASVELFGFEPDAGLVLRGGAPLEEGIELAQEKMREEAEAQRLPLNRYRAILQAQYRAAAEQQRTGE